MPRSLSLSIAVRSRHHTAGISSFVLGSSCVPKIPRHWSPGNINADSTVRIFVLVIFFIAGTKIIQPPQFKKFISVYGFRGFSPLFACSKANTAWWNQRKVAHPGTTRKLSRRKGLGTKIYPLRMNPLTSIAPHNLVNFPKPNL